MSSTTTEIQHSDYPHEPGYLIGCPACEGKCHCTPGVVRGEATECVFEGEHDGYGTATLVKRTHIRPGSQVAEIYRLEPPPNQRFDHAWVSTIWGKDGRPETIVFNCARDYMKHDGSLGLPQYSVDHVACLAMVGYAVKEE